jgi:hypothetical protein
MRRRRCRALKPGSYFQDDLVATTIAQISQEEEELHWGGSVPDRQIVP